MFGHIAREGIATILPLAGVVVIKMRQKANVITTMISIKYNVMTTLINDYNVNYKVDYLIDITQTG